MGRFFSPGRAAVALGLLASLQAEARANCFHGFVHCTACSSGYGYGVTPTAGSTGGGRLLPPPTNGNESDVSRPPAPPALAPAAQANGFAAPDASVRYFPQTSSFAAPANAYSYGAYAAPAFAAANPVAYSYGTFAAPAFAAANSAAAPAYAFAAPGSFLSGFNRNGRLSRIVAGTRLTNPQEFGSFLFQTLSTFGQNRSKADLINMGIQAFFDVLKFTPFGADLAIIEDIAEMVLSGRQGGGVVGPGQPPGSGGAVGAKTVTATVPDDGPYKVTIIVESAAGTRTTTQEVGTTTAPAPNGVGGPPPPPQNAAANAANEAVSEPPPATPEAPAPSQPEAESPE